MFGTRGLNRTLMERMSPLRNASMTWPSALPLSVKPVARGAGAEASAWTWAKTVWLAPASITNAPNAQAPAVFLIEVTISILGSSNHSR
ncbi:hypothetical protein D3C71_1431910 [compost metagenome]